MVNDAHRAAELSECSEFSEQSTSSRKLQAESRHHDEPDGLAVQ